MDKDLLIWLIPIAFTLLMIVGQNTGSRLLLRLGGIVTIAFLSAMILVVLIGLALGWPRP